MELAIAAELQTQIRSQMQIIQGDVTALAWDIQKHPETAFQEVNSSEKLASFLAIKGFNVTPGSHRLPTSFVATYGSGNLVVALCAEYDALPNGHACGHHIICGATVAAALALQPFVDQLDITLKVIGTPAEERGAGKLYLLQDGCFDDAHCALMIHPNPAGKDHSMKDNASQAVARWRATFTGKASHAAAAPELGVNAGDAIVIAQVAVGLLRQQIADGCRVASIVRAQGEATNIIPETAVADFEVRAPKLEEFWQLFERVSNCFKAGAIAAGCELHIEQIEPVYEPLKQDNLLAQHFDAAAQLLGRNTEYRPEVASASTDFGNVSQWIPGLHPWISIPTTTAGLHSDEFRDAAAGQGGEETLFDGALAMAWAVASMASTPSAREELESRKAQRNPYPITQIPDNR